MLPLSLLKTAQGHPMLVELKNGETYNGHLVNCDTWMNIHLREVICTSKDGDRFWRMPECYIRGNTIKYLRVPDERAEEASLDFLLDSKLSSYVEIFKHRNFPVLPNMYYEYSFCFDMPSGMMQISQIREWCSMRSLIRFKKKPARAAQIGSHLVWAVGGGEEERKVAVQGLPKALGEDRKIGGWVAEAGVDLVVKAAAAEVEAVGVADVAYVKLRIRCAAF
ncbi:hypothetical protein QJS10_CPA16g01517 [Acorus calamus]|uniref:U6 snRNA-associated Sm-like protein LSm4 n=1 Tax=Acorus calamus TaxID=4465 RepID=A0AAV9D0K5_ACOCL|nr:hypothetical protein QJS10_CPA16g01517 [Acorus calamus]